MKFMYSKIEHESEALNCTIDKYSKLQTECCKWGMEDNF